MLGCALHFLLGLRGRAVAMLIPPQDEAAAVRQVHGFMRSCVAIPPGRDLTAPVADEPFTAEHGELHR